MTAPALVAECLYDSPPDLDVEDVAEFVRRSLPATVKAEDDSTLVHEDFLVELADGARGPLLTRVTSARGPSSLELPHDFGHSAHWPKAAAVVSQASNVVTVLEVMGHLFATDDRIAAQLLTLQAVSQLTSPTAIWRPRCCC